MSLEKSVILMELIGLVSLVMRGDLSLWEWRESKRLICGQILEYRCGQWQKSKMR